ncbi:caspase family protein [Nocardia sp. NPDC051570]|uniref:caspase, EACC1-associated type n=1 Tax=Nocardia sp. NPDC051570 TaxID=3364324 RepID=UPI0037B3D7B8
MGDQSGRRALLVGVSQYDDEAFRDVPAALNSVRAIKSILIDPKLCGWPEECVVLIENPRKPIDIGQPLRKLALEATDTLLVYFVGHGALDEIGELCLAVGESEWSDIEFSGLEFRKLRPILKSSRAGAKIVILDCCHSGKAIEALAGGESEIANMTEISGAYTLTAAEQAAHVPSPQRPNSRTSFTHALVEIIRHGIPGGGEYLNLSTIYGMLVQRLNSEGLPKPNQRGTNTVESFEFSRNPAFASTVPGVRSVAQQIPDDPIELDMLRSIRKRFHNKEVEFLQCAVAIWKLIAPSSGKCDIELARYGQNMSVFGKQTLGPVDARIELDFILEARCYPPDRSVDFADMDKLTSRIRNSHFGVFLTLSSIEEDVYKYLRSNDHPVVVICGKDVVDALRAHGCNNADDVEEWLSGQLALTP